VEACMFRCWTVWTALALLSTAQVKAAPPSATVPHIPSGTVELDGRASELHWNQAARLDGFSVYRPRADVPPRFKAQGRVMKDDDALYFFVQVSVPQDDLYAPLI